MNIEIEQNIVAEIEAISKIENKPAFELINKAIENFIYLYKVNNFRKNFIKLNVNRDLELKKHYKPFIKNLNIESLKSLNLKI
jgi:hypothetical protein